MRRFFVDPKSISENLAILSPDESRHMATVLRLQAGAAIELFDGTGYVYQGLILTVSPKRVTVELLSRYSDQEDNAPQLFLFQSLLKGKKMDFLIQKATELGVHTFCPVQSRYSVNHGNLPRQADRWNRIMLEACKQCKRSRPMIIKPVSPFSDIELSNIEQPLILWEGEQSTRLDGTMISYEGPMALFIGPEGGYHEDEIHYAKEVGMKPVSLGTLTLRSETAALSSIAIVQFLTGALSPSRDQN